jgi:hypothetical protein
LDLSYTCDSHLKELLSRGDKAATAAHDIRIALIRAGFVATESQVSVQGFGMCPILDLVGYNRVGERVIVELKCGRSSLDLSTSSGSMHKPFGALKHNGHTKAMMQLAVQRACLAHSIEGMSPHAWLITHAYLAENKTSHISIKILPTTISDLVESHLKSTQVG